ncbi:hypothetical protein AVEN_203261-1 [Araneus ventricosus]|uniref:Uncharacterized protein n=1 Tax=Araneus ventricosus TaxID=182803 RepID=A0A4Y2BF03_ARAVE|nr:hypothetical protein AVEN_77273-1 [Araneus ventricosus]GBL90759.1 hypothetical protein AVEN_127598-1 [Araneus ventricosus]GBL90843.1 hypothetical protein AVEN_186589-1 [Araneus ventricosus]GBL90852.1 hypothetical protein AVEN_203261-1 [Araneus ventricosus]
MNIIEDIRDALLHAVENRSPPPRIPMDLWTVLKDEWCELPPRYLQTLVESIPHHVAAIMCVGGSYMILGRCTSFSGSSVYTKCSRILTLCALRQRVRKDSHRQAGLVPYDRR